MKLIMSKDQKVALKAIHKLMDDMGIGRAHTPSQIVYQIFNQQNNYASEELQKVLAQYGDTTKQIEEAEVIEQRSNGKALREPPD